MIVEKDLVSFEDGKARVSYTYDDAVAQPRVLSFRIQNLTGQPMIVYAVRAGENVFDPDPGMLVDPGFDRTFPLPNTAKFRVNVDLSIPSKPRLTNADISAQYPFGVGAP